MQYDGRGRLPKPTALFWCRNVNLVLSQISDFSSPPQIPRIIRRGPLFNGGGWHIIVHGRINNIIYITPHIYIQYLYS